MLTINVRGKYIQQTFEGATHSFCSSSSKPTAFSNSCTVPVKDVPYLTNNISFGAWCASRRRRTYGKGNITNVRNASKQEAQCMPNLLYTKR